MPEAASSLDNMLATRRRILVGSGLALLGSLLASASGRAVDLVAADPPLLRTKRSQFAILQPPPRLRSVLLKDLQDHPTDIARPFKTVRLIHIWASWCPACREDLLELEHFAISAGNEVAITTIATDKVSSDSIARFLQRLGINHLPVLLDPEGLVAGAGSGGNGALPLYGLPITYLVTRSGFVAGYISGVVDWSSPEAQALIAYYGRLD